MKNEKNLLVFSKVPIFGEVKTRLANGLGLQKALEIYHYLLKKTWEVIENLDCEVFIYWNQESPEIPENWNQFEKRIQISGNLGEKMSKAFQDSFQNGSRKVVVIGSDCPTLNQSHVEEAFEKLDFTDVVLGPTLDGGYYLLGMKNYESDLFEGISWSTSSVFQETMSKIEEMNLKYELLELLNDIDTIKDWNYYLIHHLKNEKNLGELT